MQIHGGECGIRLGGILGSFLWAVVLCGVVPTPTVFAQEANKSQPAAQTSPREDDCDQVRKSARQLSAEVSRLRAENAKLEKYHQIDYIRDLLIKEENRAEATNRELSDISRKETPLQQRLDEIDAQLRPDRIEQSLAGVGSTKPEELREGIQQQLANEKRRIQTALDQYRQNRARLQADLITAEASIARLKQRLSQAVR